MANRVRNGLFCVIALGLGGALYVLFRENTILAKLVDRLYSFAAIRRYLPTGDLLLLRFYFPDLLWSFSLCCGFVVIFGAERSAVLWAAGGAFVASCMWELLQLGEIVGGTGDILDILMYLAGCILSIKINLKKEKKQ